jgi:thiamine transport system ATP-binding protein
VSALRLEGIAVSFDGVRALAGVDLEVADGERIAVLGPSGSGKSTLLRVVAGLERPAAGRVLLDGRDMADVPAHRRGVGLMFQDGVLFPHRDVEGNVSFGLRMAGTAAELRRRRVAEVLELVGLSGFERRSVATLSGGERQRVALARALAPEPRVLLLDEPLGSLDRPLRERLLADLEALFERLELTVLHVTHDVGEAFAIADRVAVMHLGRIVQAATPDELWASPADAWVARFLGLANVREQGAITVVIRPEAVLVRPGVGATVVAAERRGPLVRLRVRGDDGEELDAVTTELDHPRAGDRVAVEIDPAGVVELPAPDRK